VEQILERAKEEGVRVGLADHAGITSYLNCNDRLIAYADFLSKYPVARGIEMGLSRSFVVSPEARSKFDYVIGSVHGIEINGKRVGFSRLLDFLRGDLPEYDPLLDIKDLDFFFHTHLELLKREFALQKYDILGHCSLLPPLALGKPEKVFPEWWEADMMAQLVTYNIAMEISNRWRTPYDRLMQKAMDIGVKFAFGSDGHEPAKSCRLEYAREMIRRFNIPEDRFFDITRTL
jgi:histidinol phosphatase-like PHP family hydrolase